MVNNAEVKGSITPMDSRGWGGVVGWVEVGGYYPQVELNNTIDQHLA